MNLDAVREVADRLARLLWPLSRPIVGYDLETTGTSPEHDRIIEVGAVKIQTDGTVKTWQTFVDPQRAIPAHITKITGIDDAMVAGAPVFDQRFAAGLAAALAGCDLCGYNVRFDMRFSVTQCDRVGVVCDFEGARVLDAHTLWAKMEPRNLSAASERFRKKPHEGAHRAFADAAVAMDAFAGQLEEWPNLPRDIDELHRFLNPTDPDTIDDEGKFKWIDGEATLMIGQHKGPMRLVPPSFWRWMIGARFTPKQKAIAKAALEGRFPSREAPAPARQAELVPPGDDVF